MTWLCVYKHAPEWVGGVHGEGVQVEQQCQALEPGSAHPSSGDLVRYTKPLYP
jgi:hypothetical protein